MCKNGLHEKDYPGLCRPCRAALRVGANARYRATPHGRAAKAAADARYAASDKGKASMARRNARYAPTVKGQIARMRGELSSRIAYKTQRIAELEEVLYAQA